jgi:WD40 repeat protein
MLVEKVAKNLKAEIGNIPLKFKTKDLFDHNWNILSKNFKESSTENFNETLEQINGLLKALEEFKKEYEQKYKLGLTKVVKTFKILKLFYGDYYTEKDEVINTKDVESLRYINSIKHELVKMEMSKDISFFQKLNDAKSIIDNLRTSSNKFNFNIKIEYDKLKYNYNFEYEIKSAHDKFITSLLVLKDDRILTTAKDYSMKIWEEKTEQYTLEKTIEKRCGCIICALPIENNKILTSSITNNTIYMWSPNNNEGLSIEQSLTLHSDIVLSMIRLENGNLVSCGKDNNVIIWKKNEGGFYEEKQTIKEERPILKLITLKNNRFGYTSDDGILFVLEESNEEKKYVKICELNHEGRILSMCEMKNGYIFTGGTGINGKKNNHIYIWKPEEGKGYVHSQTLSGHKSDVNDIIQLKDGRIISSSRDRNLIIWKENIVIDNNKNEGGENNEKNSENKIKYVKDEILSEYPHGMFLLVQLKDGRICTTTSNNSLIFWRNWGSLPYC